MPRSKNGVADAIEAVTACSEDRLREHHTALSWLRDLTIPSRLAWLPAGWATGEGQRWVPELVSSRGFRRINQFIQGEHVGLRERGRRVLDERCAMQAAVRRVLSKSAPFPDWPARDLYVRYTPIGQPRVGWRGKPAEWASKRGIRLRHLHISFTHDGNAVIALAAHAPELRGVGIDVVRLARLAGRGRDYLERFARHFMSDCEFETFLKHSSDESEEAMIRRAAAHFSLMEAASKALGTGLKIGGGMGKPESLPKRSVNARVSGLGSRVSEWEVEFDLESDAMERIRVLKASRVEGYVSADSEYLVSAAFLMV